MKQVERPRLRRWSRGEYARLIDHGILDEDDPVELLDGLLLVKEPQHSPHRTAALLTAKALERAFGEGLVRTDSKLDHPRRPLRTRAGCLRGARLAT